VSRWQNVEIQAKQDGSYEAYQAGQLLSTGFWDVEKLVDVAVDDIDVFWRSEFETREWEYESPNRVQSYTRRIRTACGRSVPDNAFYCRASHSIYYDTDLLRDQFNDIGDFAPVVIVAHEWGHAIQAQRGIFRQVRSTSRVEQQADCFAGAYVADLKARTELSAEDAEEALDLIRALPRSRTHGTPRQRLAAFQKGFDGGVTACLG
jgi:predicted metalloprotease